MSAPEAAVFSNEVASAALVKQEKDSTTASPISRRTPERLVPVENPTLSTTPTGSPVLDHTLEPPSVPVSHVLYDSSGISPPTSPLGTPTSPTSPTPSTTSSSSAVSSLSPSTPPSMLRRLNVRRRSDGDEGVRSSVRGAPDSDTDFEGMLSSFAGWQLQSRPGTPAAFSNKHSFTRTVSAVKRQQDGIRKVVESLEKELSHVHDKVSESLRVSTQQLMRTRELVANERKNMEKRHESTAYNITSLETKLNTAQRHIATLQAQHAADKDLIEKLTHEIAALWNHQEDIGGRLHRAEETEQHVRQLADRLRELMREIEQRDCEARRGLSMVPTLQEELAGTDFYESIGSEAEADAASSSNGIQLYPTEAELDTTPPKNGVYLYLLKTLVLAVFSVGRSLGALLLFLGAMCVRRVATRVVQSARGVVASITSFGFRCARVMVTLARLLAARLISWLVIALIVSAVAMLYHRVAGSPRDSPIWDALAA
ncbi:hypothetical protein FKP32DRAFT_1677295 [Trametes sanguinea]|nr:hypothetical protein FKP32DRAFT_1677295 [Trametes sanguinea]